MSVCIEFKFFVKVISKAYQKPRHDISSQDTRRTDRIVAVLGFKNVSTEEESIHPNSLKSRYLREVCRTEPDRTINRPTQYLLEAPWRPPCLAGVRLTLTHTSSHRPRQRKRSQKLSAKTTNSVLGQEVDGGLTRDH